MTILWLALAASPEALPDSRILAPPPPPMNQTAASAMLPPVQLGKSRPAVPIGNPGEWVTTQDYPSSELSRGVAGITGFILAIDNSGAVADCTVTVSSGSTVLDATACALVKARAHFTPALDANGQKTAGFYSNRVRWVVPPIEYKALPDGKWDVTVTVFINETGTIESCDFASAGNEITPDARGFTPCSPFPKGRRMQAYKNNAGKPIRYHAVLRHTSEMIPD